MGIDPWSSVDIQPHFENIYYHKICVRSQLFKFILSGNAQRFPASLSEGIEWRTRTHKIVTKLTKS